LNEEMWSTYSFKALERKLDIHQQSLSRALKRLRELELIEKTPEGYKLIKKNMLLSSTIMESGQVNEEEEPEPLEPRKKYKKKIQSVNSDMHSH